MENIRNLCLAIVLQVSIAANVYAAQHGPVPSERARQVADHMLKGLTNKAEAGDSEALLHLGQLYAIGGLIPRDLSKAESYFERYVGKDAGRANEIGEFYISPAALPHRAYTWFKRAVESDSAKAYFNLGKMYRHGDGVHRDFSEAYRLLWKALSAGIQSAHSQLAIMYFNGEGRSINYTKARRHFLAAPDRHLHAVYLGQLFRRGLGGPADPKEAETWFLTAVNTYKSWPAPMAKLADMHRHGEMPSVTPEEALAWYLLATSLGHEHSEKQVRALDNQFTREMASRAVKIAFDYARAAKLPPTVLSYLSKYREYLSR